MNIAAAIALGVFVGIPIGIAIECFIRRNDTRLKSDNLKPDTYMFSLSSYRNSHRYQIHEELEERRLDTRLSIIKRNSNEQQTERIGSLPKRHGRISQ